jgi:hypothetical protein|tara:strand:- start:1924 stop:2247 length:324 start_codon:yes stop_codon:yes gene_type:complete
VSQALIGEMLIHSIKLSAIKEDLEAIALAGSSIVADSTEWFNWHDIQIIQSFDEIETALENMQRLLVEVEEEKVRLEFLRLQNPEEDMTAEEYEEYQSNWMNEHTND